MLQYATSWSESHQSSNNAESASLRHNANLQISKSFWNNRAYFSFGQIYSQQENEYSAPSGPGGFIPVPVTISNVSWVETNDPINPAVTTPANYLITGAVGPPLPLTPTNPPMDLLMQIDFENVADINLYTTVDIDSYAGQENGSYFGTRAYSNCPPGARASLPG